MKAAVFSRYGPPHVVLIEDVEKPLPKDDEVLIKVRAASVNPLDWHSMRGSPYIARMMGGLRKPKDPRLGVDVAGQIEAVGKNAGRFKPGDDVFGLCKGAFAEYACASESALAAKSEHVTFKQAAAVPVAALTALQGLRDKGRIQPGQKVLINGASGGVGTFAVQIAKWFGADVTGVCSSRNVDLVRTLGADRVVDYTQEDCTQSLRGYHLFLDCVGNHSLSACRRILSPKGRLVVISGPDGRWRSCGTSAQSARLVAVHKPGPCPVYREVQQRGPHAHSRAHAGWKGDAGHRQVFSVERSACGCPAPGGRTRPGKSSHTPGAE